MTRGGGLHPLCQKNILYTRIGLNDRHRGYNLPPQLNSLFHP